MARKKTGDTLIITPQDDLRAAFINKRALLDALDNASIKKFEDFLSDNIAPLIDIFPKMMGHIAAKSEMTVAEMRAIIQPALKKVPADKLSKLNLEKIVSAKAIVTPERVAEERQDRERRRAEFRARRNENFVGIFTELGKGLSGAASILTGATSLRATLPTAINAALRMTVFPAAKAVGTTAAILHIPRAYGYTASAAATAAAVWGSTVPAFDPGPYIAEMSTREMMQEACIENPVAFTSTANAVYVTTPGISTDNDIGQLARSVMLHGAKHGVPAIALHYMSYLETGKFSDTVANNSTASGFFQVIDATKFRYIKNYGEDTFVYKEAAQRIENGTASNHDRLLVTTFDTISETPQETLNNALKDKKLNPIQLQALTLAQDPYVQADLVGASMAKLVPEIMEEGLSAQEILELTAHHYASDHFLGMPTFNKLDKIAQSGSQEPISVKFPNIVAQNPGLLSADMTAEQALDSIQTKFMDYVAKPAQAFETAYTAAPVDICLTKEARAFFPDKISLAEIAWLKSGLQGDYDRAVEYASWTRDYAIAGWEKIQPSVVTDDIPAGAPVQKLTDEMTRAASSFTPQTSIRPEPRPAHLEKSAGEIQVAGLSTSAKPRARPDGLAK